jgi:hypothetical protein
LLRRDELACRNVSSKVIEWLIHASIGLINEPNFDPWRQCPAGSSHSLLFLDHSACYLVGDT